MDRIDPIVLMVLNCCGLPLVGAVLGSAVTFLITRGYRVRFERSE